MDKYIFQKVEQVPERRDVVREQVFVQLIIGRIMEEFKNDLHEVFDEEDDVNKIHDIINGLESSEQNGVLALPKSIRKRRMEVLKNRTTKNGVFDAELFVSTLNADAKANGFTIGYHTSPYRILEKDGDWTIDGTDFDDRDERKMAYYSLDYRNLFRKNRGNYVYVVRAELGENSTHKKDTSNNWGRADKLSVISQLSLPELDKAVEEITEEQMKKAV